MGKKVLVTGAGGFIGSHLAERLVQEGHRVRAFVRYSGRDDRGHLADLPVDVQAEIEVERGDLKDPAAVRKAVAGQEWVFHLGALIAIPYSYQNPYDVVQTNVLGTAHVLDACRHSPALERVVLTSTSEVYGTARSVPIDEGHPLQGQSPYAATKIAADALGESYHRAFDLPVTILRPFNTFGPRQSARAIIPTIISQALSRPVDQAGPAGPAARPDLRQGYGGGLRRDRGLRRGHRPCGQHRPGRGHLDRRAGRDDRRAAGKSRSASSPTSSASARPPARSSGSSPAPASRRASGAGSPAIRSNAGSTRRSPGSARTSTGSGSMPMRLDELPISSRRPLS